MPIPDQSVHVNLVGHYPRGEEFVCGFWCRLDAPITQPGQANEWAAAMAENVATDHDTGPVDLITTDSGYDTVRAYFYGTPAGTTAGVIGSAPITGMAGQAGGGGMPLQVSLTMSLLSGLNGGSYRGRIYVPANGASLSSGQMTQADLDAQTAWWKAFLDRVNSDGDLVCTPAIASKKLGLLTPVTAVAADSRLDIQRRRANSEIERFQSSAALAG